MNTDWEIQLIRADARKLPLADASVQCIVTSPPYWGLRKYAGEQESIWGRSEECEHTFAVTDQSKEIRQSCAMGRGHAYTTIETVNWTEGTCVRCGAWRGAYGLEPTVEMYVRHSVEILRELRRVLRPDGVLFWNIRDSYSGAQSRGNTPPSGKQATNHGTDFFCGKPGDTAPGLKPKDLCLIPARIALAAQSDGWWVRSLIVWAKPNPMPESVTDRPTDAYEHILMLTKSERYYWDADAVREPSTGNTHDRGDGDSGPKAQERGSYEGWMQSMRDSGYKPGHDARDGKERFCSGTGCYVPPGGRNLRNVWHFPTQPYSGAHFATFPEELPRRCILAATSAKGACAQCGAPWQRVVKASGGTIGQAWHDHSDDLERGQRDESGGKTTDGTYRRDEIGWTPTCRCRGQRGDTPGKGVNGGIVPCVVLDPFGGSGTTGRVALSLRRRAVLCDVAYGEGDEYRRLAETRTRNVDVELPFL